MSVGTFEILDLNRQFWKKVNDSFFLLVEFFMVRKLFVTSPPSLEKCPATALSIKNEYARMYEKYLNVEQLVMNICVMKLIIIIIVY